MVRRCGVAVVLLLALGAAFAGLGSAAKSSLKPPKSGAWKLIAAEYTPTGVKVNGGVVGGFTVVGGTTIKGFHLTFTEEGESVGCAGGEAFEGKGEDKKATIKFDSGASAPIIKTTTGYFVGGSNGVGVQGVEVPIKPPAGSSRSGVLFIDLVPRKKEELRSGSIGWAEGTCSVAFIAKPG
jgi:hypothetical protein